jgi:hypothetical protein
LRGLIGAAFSLRCASGAPSRRSSTGTEEELEVDGLRAGVAAPHPAERRADEEDRDDDAEAEEEEEDVVGRVERRPEDVEETLRGRSGRPGALPGGTRGSATKRTKSPQAIARRIFQ